MIRVLHVVSLMNRGGQESLIMNLYRNIDRTKIQFDVLCTIHATGDYDDEIYKLGGKIFYLPESSIRIKHFDKIEVIYEYARFFKNHPEYKIVHFHNYHAYSTLIQVLGAKIGMVKNIILHSHNTNAPNRFIHFMARPILSLLKVTRFACSEGAGKWMYQNKSFKVINNGVDFSLLSYNKEDRNNIRESLSINKVTPVFCHVGRFNYQKNHKFLLKIFRSITDIRPDSILLLVGNGELKNDIRNEINNLKLSDNVLILGTRSDVPHILSASDVLLFPSLFEGLSVLLVEAQINNIPIVCSDTITKEGIFSQKVVFCSLDESPSYWANIALKAYTEMDRSNFDLNESSKLFDIKEVARDLQDFYCRVY